jgi:hypothetical protein
MRKAIFIAILALSLFGCGGTGTGTAVDGGNRDEKSNECDIRAGDNRPAYCRYAVPVPFEGSPNVNDHILVSPGGLTIRSVVDVPMLEQLVLDQAANKVIADWLQWHSDMRAYTLLTENQIVLVNPDAYSVQDDPGAGLVKVWHNALGGSSHAPIRSFVTSADTCYGCPGFFTPEIPRGSINLMAVIPHQANVDPAHPDQQSWSHLQFFRESAYNSMQHILECGNVQHQQSDGSDLCLQYAVEGNVHPHDWGTGAWSLPLPTITMMAKAKRSTATPPAPCHGSDCKPVKAQ